MADDQDPEMQLTKLLAQHRNFAHAAGNETLAKSLEDLAAASLARPEAALQAFVDGPEYNSPRAKEARAFIQSVIGAHNKAFVELTTLFKENASDNHRAVRKMRRDFMAVCDKMRPLCNSEYIHTTPNGSTLRGPKIVVEAEICMDPLLKADANRISDFWAQTLQGIESGARHAAGIPQDAGVRLSSEVDPGLN